ncbi:hypothetical protein KIW84_014322 [Lathyrus oleraceus]|uniref:Sm domain-containing protein n=1 Tax=Pisum sativum TaxID=3888 RepID=A0A9D5BN15_PEA|nr:hypothetical protein KIW84_014322 [Pisum sativum]
MELNLQKDMLAGASNLYAHKPNSVCPPATSNTTSFCINLPSFDALDGMGKEEAYLTFPTFSLESPPFFQVLKRHQSQGKDRQHPRESIGVPKDHLCTIQELQLHLDDWYYIDGSGREKGPSSFSELQYIADQGIKLLILLRDGRKLMGTLRSFDQFANAVLEGACERVIVAIENPQDIIVQSARPYGQRAVLKFEFMLLLEGTLLEPSPISFKLPSVSPVFSSSPIQNPCDNRSYKIITKQ